MSDLATLQTRLEELRDARASGARRIRYDNKEIEFRDDNQLAAAIADVERQIAELEGRKRPQVVNIRNTRGWT